MHHTYNIGDQVCLIADKTRIGIISKILASVGELKRFEVFHSPVDIGQYYENQIEPLTLCETLKLPPKKFGAVLSSIKYCLNTDDTVYALNSGKIKFIPFQFRPLTVK